LKEIRIAGVENNRIKKPLGGDSTTSSFPKGRPFAIRNSSQKKVAAAGRADISDKTRASGSILNFPFFGEAKTKIRH